MTLERGIYDPVITPFDSDENVDHGTLAELVRFGIDNGTHGVYALGSAGQGPAMGDGQRQAALETIVDAADGQVPVIAHIGTADTESSVELARHAEAIGADMVASLPPYYYTTPNEGAFGHNEYEVKAHFERIARAVDLELLLYNNPGFTGENLSPGRVSELVEEIPSIRGIKSGRTQPEAVVRYVETTPEGFMTFANVNYLLPTVYHGIHGTINPPMSVFPEVVTDYWEAITDRDIQTALDLQQTIRAYSETVVEFAKPFGRGVYNPLYEFRGIELERYPKWDTKPIPEEEVTRLFERLESLGLGQYLDRSVVTSG